mmetsp:Transcript_57041/g.69664  ORF Transcript_57041/g.69664 Transcript_57041/m.69664 type:complete len:154 (-) Transcript_57041:173-634(-)
MADFECGNIIFNFLDIIAGILIVIQGIIGILSGGLNFQGFIINIYLILFGIFAFLFAFYIPAGIGPMLPFYQNFLGRGLSLLFIGCLMFCPWNDFFTFCFIAGLWVILLSGTYILFYFLVKCGGLACALPPPFKGGDPNDSGTNPLLDSQQDP